MTVTDLDPTADEFFTADDPGDLERDDADYLKRAADGPPPDDPDRAPFGWTRDTKTHEWRPKKSPGRPKAAPPPGPDEVAAGPPVAPRQDAPPPPPDRKHKRLAPNDADVPMPKSGTIAKGVDRLYRRAGKFLRIMDDELGLAVIECSRPDPDDPEMPTAGQAWEALARDNVRVRAWLLNMIKGGTYQDLLMAHAPIGIALLTRDWVRRLIPGARLEHVAEVLLEQDEDSEPGDLTPEDAASMQATAEAQAQRIASKLGVRVPPNVAAAAMKQAQAMADARQAPEAFRRQQPARGNTRAKRRAK